MSHSIRLHSNPLDGIAVRRDVDMTKLISLCRVTDAFRDSSTNRQAETPRFLQRPSSQVEEGSLK